MNFSNKNSQRHLKAHNVLSSLDLKNKMIFVSEVPENNLHK